MNLFSILRFLRDHADDLIFMAIFLVVFFFFLKEFKLTSKNSWAVLLGFTAMGGLLIFRAWRRRKFLDEFRRREKLLEELEKEYDSLKAEAKITAAAYEQAKTELQRAKMDAGLSILAADADLRRNLEEIRRTHGTMTVEESLQKIEEALHADL